MGHGDVSRRNFLSTTAAGIGAAFLAHPFSAWALKQTDPTVADIVARTIGVDAHNHLDVPMNAPLPDGTKFNLVEDMTKSGLSAICMTFAVDRPALHNPGEAYERFINGLNVIDQVLGANNIKRSMNLADIRAAHRKHKPAIIQAVEGGHFLEGKLDRLEVAYKRGLRLLGLLHDNDASVPLGDVYTNPPQWGGLTSFGAEVIQACNKMGILVDLTHANNETIDAALKVATKPVIISHTGLDTQLGQNESSARMMKPRLISKAQAKIVADAGGVLGVWTHLSETPLAYAQNIRAMVDAAGMDHVCLGTDTKLTAAPSPDGKNGRGGRTNEAWPDQKVGFYYAVVDALLKTGFSEEEIGKIGGGNFCRVFDAATQG